MLQISMMEKSGTFPKGVSVLDVVKELHPTLVDTTIACFSDGLSLGLSYPLTKNCILHPITFQHEEGRRIYERTLRFILYIAVKRLFPNDKLRVEHSLGYGIYACLLHRSLTMEEIAALKEEMENIVRCDYPFTLEKWTKQQAVDYFQTIGETDKVHLLDYRPYDFFYVYQCNRVFEYFYGTMLPSTSYVTAFDLLHNAPGFVLQMPSPNNPKHAAKFKHLPKHLGVFQQSNQWCRILECSNAADLNDMISHGKFREFIRVNEALHDKSIATIAQDVVENGIKAVFVAGPSSSGKTTFSNRLGIHFRVLGKRPFLISLDDFYLDRVTLPLEKDGEPDLESLYSLNIECIQSTINDLLHGKETYLPHFDFKKQRCDRKARKARLAKDQILIIEGIHGLNPILHSAFDQSVMRKVFITELTCLNLDNHNRIRTTDARLLRRLYRDHHSRNVPIAQTLKMWEKVRAGEEKWIFPYQEQADYVFNSALHYELPVLKTMAKPLLATITKEDDNYIAIKRINKVLAYFLPAPKEHLQEIPPLSILREFIGDCTFYD